MMSDTPSTPTGSSSVNDPLAEQQGNVASRHARPHPSGDHQIIGLISLFTAAILVVVGAVWALTAVGGWWMLALAVAVHLTASAVVLAEVAAVMSDQSLTMAVIERIGSFRRAHRKQPVAR
jgi:small-conductance mechanosensitive channel